MTGSILLVNCAAVSKSVFPSDQTGCYRCQTENKPHICFRSENFQRFSVSGTDQLTSPLRNSAHSTMNGQNGCVVLFFPLLFRLWIFSAKNSTLDTVRIVWQSLCIFFGFYFQFPQTDNSTQLKIYNDHMEPTKTKTSALDVSGPIGCFEFIRLLCAVLLLLCCDFCSIRFGAQNSVVYFLLSGIKIGLCIRGVKRVQLRDPCLSPN